MTVADGRTTFPLDQHAPEYRQRFEELAGELHARCPVAWSDKHDDGFWVVASHERVFEIARRADVLSNDHDVEGVRRGYQGITIPVSSPVQSGFLEMDPPEQRLYRQVLNPYLSPAAVKRWVPVMDALVQACLDEKIETGEIDFVHDLANIVPAVLTMGLLGFPLADWVIYCDPIHQQVYTKPNTPEFAVVMERIMAIYRHLGKEISRIRENPQPGMLNALIEAEILGERPDDTVLIGMLQLLMGGGFDTTTALTAHALEWLSDNPDERARLRRERETLLDSATEEFLRFFTPAPGDGRTVSADCELGGEKLNEGERLWLSWSMANRDATVFPEPNTIRLDRAGNRHLGFGLGIHRCIGSNMARMTFKRMLVGVLDRMPDFACVPEAAEYYDTIGTINGMKSLPARFTPGTRRGPGLAETIARMQKITDEQRLAEPVTRNTNTARIG